MHVTVIYKVTTLNPSHGQTGLTISFCPMKLCSTLKYVMIVSSSHFMRKYCSTHKSAKPLVTSYCHSEEGAVKQCVQLELQETEVVANNLFLM